MKVLILFVFGVVCASAAITNPVPIPLTRDAGDNQPSDDQPWNNHHKHQSHKQPSNDQPLINQPSQNEPLMSLNNNQFAEDEPSHKQPSKKQPLNKQPSHYKPLKEETSPSTTQQLVSDFRELVQLIPISKIINIALQYEQTSPSFLNTMAYIVSPQYIAFSMQTIKTPEFQAIINYLADSGLDIKQTMNDIVNQQQVAANSLEQVPASSQEDAETTVNKFFMDVFNVLPKKEISTFVVTKLQTSPAYKTFFTRVRAPAMYILVQDLLNAPQLASGFADLKTQGVDIREYLDLFAPVLGF